MKLSLTARANDLAAPASGRWAPRGGSLNLEHHRKEAKRLLRALKTGAPEARTRAAAVLGEPMRSNLQLSDVLHVIACEQGYRSWPELKEAANEPGTSGEPDRIEATLDSRLEYRPGEPIRIRVVRRGSRTWVSDDGAAVERAGRPTNWRQAADRVSRELEVNFSRSGMISLPVVPVGPSEEQVVRRIAEASRAFYQELLELE
jgi:hypothetical protein